MKVDCFCPLLGSRQDVGCVVIGHCDSLVDFEYLMVFDFYILFSCDYLVEILVCDFFHLRLVSAVVVSVWSAIVVVAVLVVSWVEVGSV